MTKNHGLIIPKIETPKEGVNHVLGSTQLTEKIIRPDGDWLPLALKIAGESQRRNGKETNSCTLNVVSNAEDLLKANLGEEWNSSECYLANVAKHKGILNPNIGADPHKIAEMRRNESGSVAEALAPWRDDYYSLDFVPLIPEAVKEYKKWKFNHKWLWSGYIPPEEKRRRIQDALKKGVVGVSGVAWVLGPDGYYIKPPGSIDGHNFIIAQAKDDLPYKAYDSYPESEGDFIKDLDPLFDFAIAKVYWLTPAPFLKNLYFQMMDPEVARLQSALVSLRYQIPHAVTNVYGTETRSAVHSFQRDNGIEGNFGNNVGPKTRYVLNTKLNPTAPFGGSFLTYIGSLFSHD